jgi:hypothetical protein
MSRVAGIDDRTFPTDGKLLGTAERLLDAAGYDPI